MKFLITSVLFIFNFAFAQNLPILEGQFLFQPQYLNALQARHQIIIHAQNEVAKKYIDQLKSTGYICQFISGSAYNCKLTSSKIPESQKLVQSILNKYNGTRINFDRATTDYVLINDAPAVKEYQANQTSQMGSLKFDQTNILVLKDLVKIKLTKQGTSSVAYLNMTPEGFLAQVIQVSHTLKPSHTFVSNESYIYLYELIYL